LGESETDGACVLNAARRSAPKALTRSKEAADDACDAVGKGTGGVSRRAKLAEIWAMMV
jgi:hypothetical protein